MTKSTTLIWCRFLSLCWPTVTNVVRVKKTIYRVYGKAPLLQTAGISVSGTVLSLTTDHGLAYFRPTVTDSLEWFLEDSRAAETRDLSVTLHQCRTNVKTTLIQCLVSAGKLKGSICLRFTSKQTLPFGSPEHTLPMPGLSSASPTFPAPFCLPSIEIYDRFISRQISWCLYGSSPSVDTGNRHICISAC